MPNFSAVVLTLNEARYIEGCLQSLTWCDEIIVLDSDSEDDTVEIASKYADTVLERDRLEEGEGFDHLRSEAIKETSHEWIVVLDADERFPEKLAIQLPNIILSTEPDVIRVPRKNIMFGEWINAAGCWPDYKTRIFRRHAVSFTSELHQATEMQSGMEVLELPADPELSILHYNYEDVSEYIERMNRYTSIEAKQTSFSWIKFLFKPPFVFFYRFIVHRGFKLGWTGLVLCSLMFWYHVLVQIKAKEDRR